MDQIAQEPYRRVRFPESNKTEDSIATNDAFVISSDNKWYFIEFKNGSVDKADLYRKIYDSLIILLELGLMPDYSCIRGTVNYILVYNSEKYGKIQASKARDMNFDYIIILV